MEKKGNTLTLMVGMKLGTATMENGLEGTQEAQNRVSDSKCFFSNTTLVSPDTSLSRQQKWVAMQLHSL